MVSDREWCTRDVFWGSHGCDKGDHADDIHECEDCSQCRIVDDETAEVRFWHNLCAKGQGHWGPWQPGWSWFTFDPAAVPKLP